MPKISDEKRAARRAQILDAAWSCFQKEGLHATTMDHIIRASGLSAGAVYSYYPSKDELISAAVTTSLTELSGLIAPILMAEPPLSPQRLLGEVAATIDRFTMRKDYDLKRIALLGWTEAQRNEQLRQTMRGYYAMVRGQLERVATGWQRAGQAAPETPPKDVAKLILSILFGFVVQAAILGDVAPEEIAAGLAGLGLTDVATAP